ncbi:MAG TPA: PIG-L deacetylase family protein [Pirellulales bacterium]|jgi:LmbE family N-acetylglucosaminyl deacetylase|nr:PIG-L deacetylase family protein [Pirellulales bacterium]
MPSVFAIAAHPDDIEFVMAGTMMRLKDAGYELHYMTVANGSCGSSELDAGSIAQIRGDESRAAAAYLGATYHPPLARDIEIFYDRPTLARLGSIVRHVAPQILLTHSPQDYMEDHTNTCRLAVTAAFCRGMRNFPVDPPREAIDTDVTIYHAQPHGNCDPLRQPIVPEHFVDVTSLFDRKTEMLVKHQSQKAWLDRSQGMDSYVAAMRELNAEVGRLSGSFALAEGWRRHLHLGFSRADVDPLAAALAQRVLVRS